MAVTVLSNRYELSDQLGSGGMAQVYLGRDRVLGRTVAVKTLLGQYAGDPHFIERFRREATSAAALNHPNIVSVYDTGSDEGTHYIVMEYVQGSTLRDVVRAEGPLLPERVAEIAAEVCAGLAAAHTHGVVHRDIKPANIMITPTGGVKVADFGIARAVSGETVTQTAMVLGTAQYFSPEQAQSTPVDARSDLYSLGVVMYEMLTRQVPFTGSSPVAIAYKHVKEDPILPSRLNPDVPEELEAIVMKAMAKNPNNRYQSASEMREDLLRAIQGRPVQAPPVLSDATGMINMSSDETIVMERRPATATMIRREPTPEERKRRKGIWLLALIILAILAIAAWAIAGLTGGTTLVTVPDVRNETTSRAQERLEAAGFEVRVLDPVRHDKIAVGRIISQDPANGERVAEGSVVSITPSSGPTFIEIPDLVGKTESAARDALKRVGLEVGEVDTEYHDRVRRGLVISSAPSKGALVREGQKVDLVVSLGRETVEVPDVQGFNEQDATDRLESRGFRVQTLREEQSPDCDQPEGRVCRQTPESGSRVERGSTVTIYVAEEPEEETPTPTPTESLTPTETASP